MRDYRDDEYSRDAQRESYLFVIEEIGEILEFVQDGTVHIDDIVDYLVERRDRLSEYVHDEFGIRLEVARARCKTLMFS